MKNNQVFTLQSGAGFPLKIIGFTAHACAVETKWWILTHVLIGYWVKKTCIPKQLVVK